MSVPFFFIFLAVLSQIRINQIRIEEYESARIRYREAPVYVVVVGVGELVIPVVVYIEQVIESKT